MCGFDTTQVLCTEFGALLTATAYFVVVFYFFICCRCGLIMVRNVAVVVDYFVSVNVNFYIFFWLTFTKFLKIRRIGTNIVGFPVTDLKYIIVYREIPRICCLLTARSWSVVYSISKQVEKHSFVRTKTILLGHHRIPFRILDAGFGIPLSDTEAADALKLLLGEIWHTSSLFWCFLKSWAEVHMSRFGQSVDSPVLYWPSVQ